MACPDDGDGCACGRDHGERRDGGRCWVRPRPCAMPPSAFSPISAAAVCRESGMFDAALIVEAGLGGTVDESDAA